MYNNRNFLIFSLTEVDKIQFSQVCETSAETLRVSTDGTKSFIKWDQAPYDPTPYEIVNPETNETETITPEPPGPPGGLPPPPPPPPEPPGLPGFPSCP